MDIESYAKDTLYLGSMWVVGIIIVGIAYSLIQGDDTFELMGEMTTNPFWWLLIGGFLFLALLPDHRKAKWGRTAYERSIESNPRIHRAWNRCRRTDTFLFSVAVVGCETHQRCRSTFITQRGRT